MKKILLLLFFFLFGTTVLAFSLGAIWKEKGENKTVVISKIEPSQETHAQESPNSQDIHPSQQTPPHEEHRSHEKLQVQEKLKQFQIEEMQWSIIAEYLGDVLDRLESTPCLEFLIHDWPCRFSTSLELSYQTWVKNQLSQSRALAGVAVAMDPNTGKILTLATYNTDPYRREAHFWHTYPAASLFKIVTAAAAVDLGLLQPESMLTFNGHPYTLYQSSLTTKVNRWTRRVTLCSAFAKSLNPVFGKIGVYVLGPKALAEYGSAFFFNHSLPTEIPLETSHLEVPQDTIGVAEIASGLNHVTKISPVHAAWLASVILNGGAAPMPWLIERVEDDSGRLLYRHASTNLVRVIPLSTAEKMRTMMQATITEGTCKRRFGRWKNNPVLNHLELGGKTGNVNNAEDTRKYDWFVGYGFDPGTKKKVVISILLIHGTRLGNRANALGHDMLKKYFE